MKGADQAGRDVLANAGECRPFIEMARAKEVSLDFSVNESGDEQALWRVDLDLVRISIENALWRATQNTLDKLAERLAWLLREGTKPQQIDFVSLLFSHRHREDGEVGAKGRPCIHHATVFMGALSAFGGWFTTL
jgi:hypothetical protein